MAHPFHFLQLTPPEPKEKQKVTNYLVENNIFLEMEPNLPVNSKTSWTYQGMELGPFVLVAGKLEFPSKPPFPLEVATAAWFLTTCKFPKNTQKAKGHTF